ncbi:MAG: hypothetical protein AB1646_12010 [Thermodesulfobacteriota bacterium]
MLLVKRPFPQDAARKETPVRFLGLVAVAAIWWAGAASSAWSETSTQATAASVPAGRPSTFSIKKDLLVAARTELQSQLRDVQRCIQKAEFSMRDERGRINRISSTDLITCARTLGQIQRKLTNLGRKAEALARDAEVMGANLESLKKRLETKERIRMGSGE